MRTMWAVFVLMASRFAFAGEEPLKVDIQHNGQDAYGKELLYRFKEEINKSSFAKLIDYKDSTVTIFMSTMPDDDDPGKIAMTIYSLVFTYFDLCAEQEVYHDRTMGYAGGNRIAEASRRLIVTFSEIAPKLRKESEETAVKCYALLQKAAAADKSKLRAD